MDKKEDYHSKTKLKEEYLQPIVSERRNWSFKNIGIALLVGAILLVIQLGIMFYFQDNETIFFSSAIVLIVTFAVFLYFLTQPEIVKEIETPVIHKSVETIEVPVVKEVEKEVPVVKEVEKKIIIEKKGNSSPKPNYSFIGSSLTKVYHLTKCRLSKSILAKYRIYSNNKKFFQVRKFKPCDVCNPNKKR